jgi:hypothetical protein
LSNFFDKRKKEVETYIRPLLDADEMLEIFTIGQSKGSLRNLLGLFLMLISDGALGSYSASTLICLTSKRLVICRAFMFGGLGKLSISPASEPGEILNLPLSEIICIQFIKGFLVSKLIVEVEEKGEFQYSFSSRLPGHQAQKIVSMISSAAD